MKKIIRLINGITVKIRYHSLHRDPSLWVFGEWFGERCCDNSRYFANYVSIAHPNIHVIWISKESSDISSLTTQISVVTMDSEEAKTALQYCGVAVISQNFLDLSSDGFNYVNGSVSVHLWHGVPWKKIGHDSSRKKNLLLSMYSRIYDYVYGTDFYLSPSDKYDLIAASAHGAKQNQMFHAGYPRNSELYNPDKILASRTRIIDRLKRIDSEFDFSDVKIISYMPTFRSDSSHFFSFDTLKDHRVFKSYLEDNNIVVIQKAHYVNQIRDGRTEIGGYDRIYSMNDVNAQDLLCASDLLITDYSGAFFDYLLLDRPIVHYLYDYDYYRIHDRGLYYDKEDVIAGEEADNEGQLVEAIIKNLENPNLYKERRSEIRNIYMKYDTPNSCEVLYQLIVKELKRRYIDESTNP